MNAKQLWKGVLVVALMVTVMAFAGTAKATIVLPYDTGFESDTLGPASSTNPADWENPHTSNITSGGINIVAGASTGGSGANAQVLEFNATATGFWGDFFEFAPENGLLKLDFKVKLATGPNSTDFKFVGLGGGVRTSFIRLRTSGGGVFQYRDGGTNSFNTILGGVVQGDWYSVEQTFDLAAETFDVTITNLDNIAQTATMSSLPWASGSSTTIMDRFEISRTGQSSANFQIDDISLSVVPEPSSFAFCALGMLVAGAVRRHRLV